MLESLVVSLILLLLIIDQCNTLRQIDTCWSSQVDYHIRSIDSNGTAREQTINELYFVRECHLNFVQNLTNRSCLPSSSSSILHSPSSAQKYGYGFLAVFIVSILSLAGFVAFPLMKKPYYKYINAFFVALAVGTLYADTAFELFPVIVEFNTRSTHHHEHGRSESNSKRARIPLMLWQMTALVLTSYVFFVIELAIHYIMHSFRPQNSQNFSHGPSQVTGTQLAVIESLPKDIPHVHTHSHAMVSSSVKSTGWMIIIADGIHNIADGLAIGAAFAENVLFGVTTTIAIACHELPTELGEYMVLIESGFTFRRALLFNFISACTAIVGFFVGASIAENENARIWIFVITAGTFTYIALVDLWPTLMPEQPTFNWIRFTCVTIGYLLGVSIMFILTIFEEEIVKRDSR